MIVTDDIPKESFRNPLVLDLEARNVACVLGYDVSSLPGSWSTKLFDLEMARDKRAENMRATLTWFFSECATQLSSYNPRRKLTAELKTLIGLYAWLMQVPNDGDMPRTPQEVMGYFNNVIAHFVLRTGINAMKSNPEEFNEQSVLQLPESFFLSRFWTDHMISAETVRPTLQSWVNLVLIVTVVAEFIPEQPPRTYSSKIGGPFDFYKHVTTGYHPILMLKTEDKSGKQKMVYNKNMVL